MPTLTTMVRAGVAIRGGVTSPSVYTHRTWLLLVNQAQYAGNAPLPGNSIAAGRLPGSAQGWLDPGWVDENDLRVQYNTPHGPGGSRRGVHQRVKVNLSGLQWLP